MEDVRNCDEHEKHPTELHMVICEDIIRHGESDRAAMFRYRVSNTSISRWLNEHKSIDVIKHQDKLKGALGISAREVLRLAGVDVSDEPPAPATVTGTSPRSSRLPKQTDSNVAYMPARLWAVEADAA